MTFHFDYIEPPTSEQRLGTALRRSCPLPQDTPAFDALLRALRDQARPGPEGR